MKRLLLLPLIALFTIAFVHTSNANVLIEDVRTNSDVDGGITSGFIDTGSGRGGDYELIACGIDTDGSNPFNAPSPGSWNEINNSTCFQPDCQLGLWGRFSDSPNSEEVTCSWGDDSVAFVAGSIRYSNVDRDNPIIDSGCSEFVDGNFVIPAVSSEPGAQLVTIQIFRVQGDLTVSEIEFDEFSAEFTEVVTFIDDGDKVLAILGASEIDENGEGFPGIEFPLQQDIFAAKFCVVSLRMQPRVVPTMSEWGLISFAAFAGIAGIWYLRRRQVAA